MRSPSNALQYTTSCRRSLNYLSATIILDTSSESPRNSGRKKPYEHVKSIYPAFNTFDNALGTIKMPLLCFGSSDSVSKPIMCSIIISKLLVKNRSHAIGPFPDISILAAFDAMSFKDTLSRSSLLISPEKWITITSLFFNWRHCDKNGKLSLRVPGSSLIYFLSSIVANALLASIPICAN